MVIRWVSNPGYFSWVFKKKRPRETPTLHYRKRPKYCNCCTCKLCVWAKTKVRRRGMYPDKRARLEYQDRILARLLIEQMHLQSVLRANQNPFLWVVPADVNPLFEVMKTTHPWSLNVRFASVNWSKIGLSSWITEKKREFPEGVWILRIMHEKWHGKKWKLYLLLLATYFLIDN